MLSMPALSKFSALIALFIMIVMPLSAKAELRVDITQGRIEPMPVSIPSFFAADSSSQQLAVDMPGIISSNLESSGLFRPIDPKAFVQSVESMEREGVRFAEWRANGSQALITGRVSRMQDGRTRVEFRLWDVFGQKQLIGTAFTTTMDNWRRIAHIISDEIYKRLTGEDGYFDSRIVYIAESGPVTQRQKRLAIMDQDGANHKYLTGGSDLVLTPRFSPTEQKIAYMSYVGGKPRVYVYDISTGRQDILGNFPGMTFAPRFSPDGRKVVMSLAKNGNTDIYVMDLGSRQSNRITDSPSIDTAPTYSPDGRRIAFESDRGGSQQIYVMNADGSGAQRITFGQGRYANPVWSPRGDLIAFTRMYQGKFYIGVIRPDGSGERLITTAYHVEGPSWSPNGRVLTYFKERPGRNGKSSNVYTVDITGFNERMLRTPGDGSDPAWSPLNK
ncbi:MAG: Tol-Pal system beta propeller repeat protein TolB [Alphaproteobacteria bacterium]|nr:Tol-Pal system beta propeller repeat protein TolB [Alphaproteobacteria bacterium]MCD8570596.1 Tol-Pal system beta propeller repeat protein TolB [Alphaproteobacteria bacterium]